MPLNKAGLKASLAKGREVKAEKTAQLASETALKDLWSSLNNAESRITQLEHELAIKSVECDKLQVELKKSNSKCIQLEADLSTWMSKHSSTYHDLRMERQTAQRRTDKIEKLQGQAVILQKADIAAAARHKSKMREVQGDFAFLRRANENLQAELSKAMIKWSSQLENTRLKLEATQSLRRELRREVTALQKASVRSQAVKEHAIASIKAKITKEASVHHLMEKGVITNQTRNIVRLLVKAGCSQAYVNEVIVTVLQSAGIETVGSISRASIARIIREGFFAAQIQLGYEMKNAESMTFSADGTGHRSINYASRHVHLLAEDYGASSDGTKKRATRFMGIQQTVDGSSEESVKAWRATLERIITLYNESPLGKRQGSLVKFVQLLTKLVGMNSDHCAKEKKDARLLEELKHWAVDQSLGEDAMLELTLPEINALFEKGKEDMIKAAGGKPKWEKLSDGAKSVKQAAMMEKIIGELGKKEFAKLPEDERRFLRLFIWAGCGCHKDLNTIRGGYAAMMNWWEEQGLEGPVLLANRENDPVIQERTAALEQGDTPTPAQEQAFGRSTRGAIKMAEIAGALFNHKDNKKGHHDVFRFWWWENVGTPFTFPDTSNNRFQSYCDAATALLLYSDEFIDFLENIRTNKQNSRLNHMEQNLWNALHCDATTTELAVLTLYAESVSYPYMKSIRTSSEKEQNMLDLGPLHQRVYNHLEKIIENPDLLVGDDTSASTGSLDGEPWLNDAVMNRIYDLRPTLPHLRDVLVRFFDAALVTWGRFTSEFAPGGVIDEATIVERELAWMPATNDENEGSLGSFRLMMRRLPSLTLLDHNALAMFFRNNTRAFMETKFTEPADHQHLRMLAREAKGEEKQRRKELVDYREKHQAEKTARKAKREQMTKERDERIAATNLVLDKEKVSELKGIHLKDQVRMFKDHGAPNLVSVRLPHLVAEMRQALCVAIDLYKIGEWLIDEDTEDDIVPSEDEDEDDWDDED